VALALRMSRIRENGKRAREKAFGNGSRKTMLLALTRLPLSQSKPLACRVMVAGKIRSCIGECKGVVHALGKRSFRTTLAIARFAHREAEEIVERAKEEIGAD
jgi:hypothetical protein